MMNFELMTEAEITTVETRLKDRYATTLRAFEAAHKVWMNTSTFHLEAFLKAKDGKNSAGLDYDYAQRQWQAFSEALRDFRNSGAVVV